MMNSGLVDKVIGFTQENALFSVPAALVVGVSGGADSMALLHLLHSWPDEEISVYVVHVNHGMRGAEADRDETLVREYCDKRHIPYEIIRADIRKVAEQRQCGLEEAGRFVRYDAFERVRQAVGADYIATAHTASDMTETMVMHLIRGCGVGGLVGIPAKRGVIVRPLLSCSRQEIEAYCAKNRIPYVVDGTNMDTSFLRNRVRHELLPLLRDMNPSIEGALLRLHSSAEQDESAWQRCAERVLIEAEKADGCLDASIVLQQSPSVRVRFWKLLLAEHGCYSYTERHIVALENVLQTNRGTVYLPNGHRISVSSNCIKCFDSSENPHSIDMAIEAFPASFVLDGREHTLELLSREDMTALKNVHKLFFKFSIDYDTIQGGLHVRFRRDGDALHPARRKVGKTLKKLFQELRVPTYYRNTYPLLCDDGGVVLMPGVACDKRVCPDNSTKHFLVWRTNGEPSYTLCYGMGNNSVNRDAIESKE